MSEKDDGGQAFPYEERNGMGQPRVDHYGMSLRDYFAAKAMQGIITGLLADGSDWPNREIVAANAYEMADAMIKERNK